MIIPDKIIRSHRRSMALIISNTGELIVRAPMRLSYDKIYNFIKEKEKWISSKQKEIQSKNMINTAITTYKQIIFLGSKYNIKYNIIWKGDRKMLIDFKVSNFRSFEDTQTFSMRAGKVRSFSERLYGGKNIKLLN